MLSRSNRVLSHARPKWLHYFVSLRNVSCPGSLRVLGALGLAESLFIRNIATPVEKFVFKTDAELLAVSNMSSIIRERYGFPFAGVKRSVFLKSVSPS